MDFVRTRIGRVESQNGWNRNFDAQGERNDRNWKTEFSERSRRCRPEVSGGSRRDRFLRWNCTWRRKTVALFGSGHDFLARKQVSLRQECLEDVSTMLQVSERAAQGSGHRAHPFLNAGIRGNARGAADLLDVEGSGGVGKPAGFGQVRAFLGLRLPEA